MDGPIEEKDQTFGSESKYWCWTLFKSDDDVYDAEYPCDATDYKTERGIATVTYTRAQEEQCKTSGRFHLQGYVEFKDKIKFTTLKNLFNKRIHWAKRRGNAQQADDYCNKEDTRVPNGIAWCRGSISKITGPGQRTDLLECISDIKSGMKRKAIADAHAPVYVKFHKGLQALANALDMTLDDEGDNFLERECYIFYGASGSGKTLACKRLMGFDNWYEPQQNAQGQLSFETYKGQKWIFLDDFEPQTLGCGTLKRMMDRGKCVLPGRGANSSVPGRHVGVCITTNIDPEKWYKDKVHWNAISRRCKQVWICGDPDETRNDIPWMIIGGTEFAAGHRVESPLKQLLEWINDQKPDGVGQEQISQ